MLPSSHLLGCLFVGDKINSVNGVTNIRTTADFLKAATSKLPGKVAIDFAREEMCTFEKKASRRDLQITNDDDVIMR